MASLNGDDDDGDDGVGAKSGAENQTAVGPPMLDAIQSEYYWINKLRVLSQRVARGRLS